ncbi:hypothetical protein ACSQ6I_15775 [Anabaena sp. WFMT]|uniref:hypothetical protein n=1 Tax=Anabaena sp. WFMT TaxID=3449730 RepID=UPI003F23B1FA
MQEKRSRISYENIFADIAKNRKDPCEVIRELVSNAYDANASIIHIYPLLQYEGFIFFDNGIGLSESDSEQINEITPYESFFSIGISTKDFGNAIGYKCQGAKLCFDSNRFDIITRCRNENSWRWKSIDNPKKNLTPHYPLESEKISEIWKTFKQIFVQPDERTKLVIDQLNEDFFRTKFFTGTMIIIQGLNVKDFSYYYGTDKGDLSYIRNYIRFNTRHGDVRILRPQYTGFSQAASRIFEKEQGYKDECELYLWTVTGSLMLGSLEPINPGYPYLHKCREYFKSPAQLSRILSFRGDSRYAKNIHVDGRNYCLILAIDGNRKVLDEHKELDRQGSNGKRSGIRLVDHRGTLICSQGVKVCQYDQIYENSEMSDYEVLSGDNGKRHYVFIINGNFDLVMNRNFITEDARILINSKKFLEQIKIFFEEVRSKEPVFDQLIKKLKNEYTSQKKEIAIEQLENRKNGLQNRGRFVINGIRSKIEHEIKIAKIEHLVNKVFVEPDPGEEHWVGALYTLLAHLISPQSLYANFWIRPLTFSGVGIDTIATCDEQRPLDPKRLRTVEYKFDFPEESFNHQLILTDQIICWQFDPSLQVGSQIEDCSEFFGKICYSDDLGELGYEIRNIQHKYGEPYSGVVKVISLKKLIDATFDCQWTPAISVITEDKLNKKGGKRKSR